MVLSVQEPGEVVDGGDFGPLKFKITEAARSGKLRQFGGKVKFSKAVWWSYGEMLSESITDFAGTVFSGIEMRLIAEMLEAASLTTVTSPALTAAGLQNAAAMRAQLNGAGQKSNLSIASIIVPPALEMTAKTVRTSLDWAGLNIVINSELTSSERWYAVCNPIFSAPILRLQLRGAGVPRVYSSIRDSGLETGMAFAVDHSVDFVIASAPGLVRVGA